MGGSGQFLDCRQPQQLLFSCVDSFWSKLVTFIFGVAALYIGFILNQTWQREKERKERLHKIIALLGAIEKELDFYRSKLNALVNDLEDELKQEIGPMKGLAIPSYDFYPAFLEKAKNALVDYHETSDLVAVVSECHYGVGSVQAKLDSYRMIVQAACEKGGDSISIMAVALNRGGLKGLAKENSEHFTAAREKVVAKQNCIKCDLETLFEHSLFGSILRE